MTKYEEQFYFDITIIRNDLTHIAEELHRMNNLKEQNQ